jgi:hypothetical protein
VERDDGRARLVFDDVEGGSTGSPRQWTTRWFFTRIEFENGDLLEYNLSEKDYATIGHAVVARLAAQHKARKRFGHL